MAVHRQLARLVHFMLFAFYEALADKIFSNSDLNRSNLAIRAESSASTGASAS